MRRWSGAFALTSIVTLVLFEVAIRIFMPQEPSWLVFYERHPRLPFYSLAHDKHSVVDTGESRWEVHTDEHGFRVGRQRTGKVERPVALWLGDSFAFGQGVDFEDSWIGLLDADPGARFHHVNSAVGGYGPDQYAAILDDLLQQGMQPKLVLAATFAGNDFHDTIWDKNLPVVDGVLGSDGGVKAVLKQNLHAYRLLSRVYHKMSGEIPRQVSAFKELGDPAAWKQEPLREGERRYEQAFARIAATCSSHGLPFVVLVLPSISMVEATRIHGEASEREVQDSRAALVRAKEIFERLGVRSLDATAVLSSQETAKVFFPFDQHLTPLGNRLVAEFLRGSLDEL